MNIIEKQLALLRKRLTSIEKEDISNYDDDYKKHLSVEEAVYRKIIDTLEYQMLSPEQKQGKRILHLAKAREQGWDTTHQLKEINLYSKIREVIPYIQAMSYVIPGEEKHLTEDLLTFCWKWIEEIDSANTKRTIQFPEPKEINQAFAFFIDYIKPNKIPSLKVYNQPEAVLKTEELYQEFLKLHD